MATFGKIAKGGTEGSNVGNYIRMCKYQSNAAGTLASISLYIKWSTNANVKCAIYDATYNLVTNGTTETEAITEGQDDWVVFDFTIQPNIAAATNYYLTWWKDATILNYHDTDAANPYRWKAASYDGWPDPIESSEGPANNEWSIYATYATTLYINVHDCTDLEDIMVGG